VAVKSYLFGLVVGAWLGVCITLTFYHPPKEMAAYRSPREFVGSPTMTQEAKAYPIDIQLRIIDASAFRKEADRRFISIIEGGGGHILAYSTPYHDPCVITMPDDFSIRFLPDKGYAIFKDPLDSDTLAHEILHCLYGDWHKSWIK